MEHSEILDALYRVEAKVDVTNERLDRHAATNEKRFETIFTKIDSFSEKIHGVEINAVKTDGKINESVALTNGKLAVLSASVSLLMAALWEGAKTFFHK